MRFSQRMGKTPIQETIQKDSMTESFRNLLTNECEFVIKQFHGRDDYIDMKFLRAYYNYFGLPYKEYGRPDYFMLSVKEHINDKQAGAYFLYDFIEFLIKYSHNIERELYLITRFNEILELEKSAYRLDEDGELTPIVDEIELAELAKASDLPKQYSGVYEHLEKAKAAFSNRENPDYKKSIAESVHAIEATCRIILVDNKATLGQAVKKLKLHKSLEESISKLYGFSSDSSGIRHANKIDGKEDIDENDARLILVSSHSIVNYLISKTLR